LEREDLKSGAVREALVALARAVKSAPDDLEQLIHRVRQAVDPARSLAHSLQATLPAGDDRVYWATRIEATLRDWAEVIDRYLHWFELLVDSRDDMLIQRSKIKTWLGKDLKMALRLRALADSEKPILSNLSDAGLRPSAGTSVLDEVGQELSRAQSRAAETIQKTEDCLVRVRGLGNQ